MFDINTEVMKFFLAPEFDAELQMYTKEGGLTAEPIEARWLYVSPQDLLLRLPTGEDTNVVLWRSTNVPDETFIKIKTNLDARLTKVGGVLFVNSATEEYLPKIMAQEFRLDESMDGSSVRSYWKLESARTVVLHSKRLTEEQASVRGARSRNVNAVFVENLISGERIRIPGTALLPAKALTVYVNNQGSFNDPVGRKLYDLATEYADLKSLTNDFKTCDSCSDALQHGSQRIQGLKDLFKNIMKTRSFNAVIQDLRKSEIIGKARIQSRLSEFGGCDCTDHPGMYYVAKQSLRSSMTSPDCSDSGERVIDLLSGVISRLTSRELSVKLSELLDDVMRRPVKTLSSPEIKTVHDAIRSIRSPIRSDEPDELSALKSTIGL